MSLVISKTYTPGEPLTAEDLNATNNEIESALGALTADDLADDAGIRKEQLADRFTPDVMVVNLLPLGSTAVIAAGSAVPFNIPNAAEVFWTHEIAARLGQQKSLVEIQLDCRAGNATDVPEFSLTKNGDPIGGSSVELDNTTQALYRVRFPNPFDQPLAACRDGDVLEASLGRGTGAGTATARGLTMTLVFKSELLA